MASTKISKAEQAMRIKRMQPKRYTFRVVTEHAVTEEADLFTMRAEWVHGIYGTHESMNFVLLITADGTDRIIWPDGRIECMGDVDADFLAQLLDFVDANLT